MTAPKRTPRCPGGARHWFTAWGAVGLRLPWCTRCGADNPRPLTADQQAGFDYAVREGFAPTRPGS